MVTSFACAVDRKAERSVIISRPLGVGQGAVNREGSALFILLYSNVYYMHVLRLHSPLR